MRENSGIIEDLCAFSDVLFSSVNVEQVLSGSIYFDSISCPYAADLLFKKHLCAVDCGAALRNVDVNRLQRLVFI